MKSFAEIHARALALTVDRLYFTDGAEELTSELYLHALQRSWSVWPFGGFTSRRLAGLHILPGAPRSRWPIVRGSRPCAGTKGPASIGALQILYEAQINDLNGPEQIEKRRQEWPAARADLRDFHLALGGDDAGLDAYEALLFSPDALYSEQDIPEEDAHLRNLLRLDPSPEHQRFRAFYHERMQTPGPRNPLPDELGIWTTAALNVAFNQAWPFESPGIAGTDQSDLEQKRTVPPFAWRLLHLPPQVDLDAVRFYSHLLSGTGILIESTVSYALVACANFATPELRESWRGDPIWDILLPEVAADPERWYLAYMEVAAAFDGLDQPEYAWNALASGAYWVGKKGGPWRPFFDAALDLARRRGWTDVVDALEHQAALALLD